LKRKFILFIFIVFPHLLAADSFTDAIQDLAVQIACTGTYNATQAGKTWRDDPYDYYTPKYMAERFTKLSGSVTEYGTFYGICYNYAKYAYNFLRNNKKSYENKGMIHDQFYIVTVEEDCHTITLYDLGKPDNYTVIRNGEKLKKSVSRRITSHGKTTMHAWLWVQRFDGQWFWIDPTWTDNFGYVVWGYIDEKSGKEVQLRPKKDYCINYPSSLYNLSSESVVPVRSRVEPLKPVTPNIVPLPKPVPVPEPKPQPKPQPQPAPAPKPSPQPAPSTYSITEEYCSFGLITVNKSCNKSGFGLEASMETACIDYGFDYLETLFFIGFFDVMFNTTENDYAFGFIGGASVGLYIIPLFEPFIGFGLGFGAHESKGLLLTCKITLGFRVELNPYCFRVETTYDSIFGSCCTVSVGFAL